jgi:hypothetical protein
LTIASCRFRNGRPKLARPRPAGTFAQRFAGHRAAANELVLESSAVAMAVMQFARDVGSWTGSPSELLRRLNDRTAERTRAEKSWPKRPNTPTGRLRRLAPNLAEAGIDIEQWREPGGHRRRTLAIRNVAQ